MKADASSPSCSGGESGRRMVFAWSLVSSNPPGHGLDIPVSVDPRTLSLSPYALHVAVTYVFQITVSMESNPEVTNSASVTVVVEVDGLQAEIGGFTHTNTIYHSRIRVQCTANALLDRYSNILGI